MSLLAKFFTQIKSSQEDIASDGLKHILQNSLVAKSYLKTLLFSKTQIELPELTYTNQVTKKDLGRTDISGLNNLGNEVLILEAKFWASLTENQPISYLKRMESNSILVFICPSLRKKSIFTELKRKLVEGNIEFRENKELLTLATENNKQIVVQSWNEILEPIRNLLKENNDERLVSDIDQIIGFCEVIDKNSFIPLSENDMSPEIGRRINSYYILIDEIFNELSKNENYKQDKLTEGKPKNGFGFVKYRKYDNLTFSFGLNYTNWTEFADTPFWLKVTEQNFEQSQSFKSNFYKIAPQLRNQIFETNLGGIYYPIYPTLFEDKEKVAKDMSEQIIEICEMLK